MNRRVQRDTELAMIGACLMLASLILASLGGCGLPYALADDDLTRWGTPEGTFVVDIPGHLGGAFDGRSRCARYKIEYNTPRSLSGPAVRPKAFAADLRTPAEFRPLLTDYRGASLYDRGHVAPCADFPFSQKAMDATFLLSNMTPQFKQLNEGLWSRLEKHTRELVTDNCRQWVATGPLFSSGGSLIRIHTIGDSHVWVPTHYFKSVLLLAPGEELPSKLRSWIVPNEPPASGATIWDFTATVDQIEAMAGLDLWSELPDDKQELLEACK